MTEVNPDTLLLGEFTGDAALDFPGDAWHGAMTYANFTRPVWNWLREPGSAAGGGLHATVGITRDWDGVDAVESHREFAAALPWRVRTRTMNALDTHDIPRFSNDAKPGTVPVAIGLAMTMPGIPVIWAGDEFGLTGIDGEDSRTPLPWDRAEPRGRRADRALRSTRGAASRAPRARGRGACGGCLPPPTRSPSRARAWGRPLSWSPLGAPRRCGRRRGPDADRGRGGGVGGGRRGAREGASFGVWRAESVGSGLVDPDRGFEAVAPGCYDLPVPRRDPRFAPIAQW